MQGLERPLPNPSYRKPTNPEEDDWADESYAAATPRPPSSVVGYESTEIPVPNLLLRPAEDDWETETTLNVPRTPGNPTTQQEDGNNNNNSDWDDEIWAKASNVGVPATTAKTTGFDYADGYGPPASMISLPSPAFSDVSKSKSTPKFYAPAAPGTNPLPDVSDDWNEDGFREFAGVTDVFTPPVSTRDPADSRIRRTTSGKEFPLLLEDDSIDLVRDELCGRRLDPNDWNVQDVKEFVKANGYSVQARDLAKEKVDGDQLMGLNRDKLSMIRGFQCDRALSVAKLLYRLRTLLKPPNDGFRRPFSGRGGRGMGRGRGGGGSFPGLDGPEPSENGWGTQLDGQTQFGFGDTDGNTSDRPTRGLDNPDIKCYRCNEMGHYSSKCTQADTRGSGGGRGRGAGGGNEDVKCYRCNEMGHYSSACTQPDTRGTGGRGRGGGNEDIKCYRCNEMGHYSSACTQPDTRGSGGGRGGGRGRGAGGGNEDVKCYRCNEMGHYSSACTQPDTRGTGGRGGGRGGGTRNCYKCNGIGHIARDCTESSGGNPGYSSTSQNDEWGITNDSTQRSVLPEDDDWGDGPTTTTQKTRVVDSNDDWETASVEKAPVAQKPSASIYDDDGWGSTESVLKRPASNTNDEWGASSNALQPPPSKVSKQTVPPVDDDDEWA